MMSETATVTATVPPKPVSPVKESLKKFCEPWLKASWAQRRWWACLVLIYSSAFIAACYFFQTHYWLGVDTQRIKCIDATVFVVNIRKSMPQRDQIFAVTAMNAEPVIKNGTMMAMYIRGLPGDKVTITPDEKIYINDKLIATGMAHLHGVNPKDMRKFFGTRILGEDEYWVMGTLPMSFDSRYYGPVKSEQIKGRAYVLF